MAAVPAAQEPPEPWEQQRFGLGLRLGSLGLSQGEGSEQTYGTAGIAARYRLTRRWELELALDHGTEQREDGSAGLQELNSSTLSALFHLRPQARWDLYLLAGVGSSERRFSDRERWDEAVPHVALGLGLERRFEHLVLGVELRALVQPPVIREDIAEPAVGTAATSVRRQEQEAGGGQATLSASWYF
jgi:hypothetical protein